MPGIDTISLYLPKEKIGNYDYMENMESLLTNQKTVTYKNSKVTSLSGNRRNLLITYNERGVTLKGSLPKFCDKDSIDLLDFPKVHQALQKLSDEFKMPFDKAKLRRIDIAENFKMNQKPAFYYPYLGNINRYRRLEQNNGLMYQQGIKKNGIKGIVFYDKLDELKDNKVIIPIKYENQNLLRYEFRFFSRLPQQIKVDEVTLSSLQNESFYNRLIKYWHDEYFKIKKIKKMNINFEVCKTIKELETQLLLEGVQAKGGEAELTEIINQIYKAGNSSKMQCKRMKDKLKTLCNTPNLTYQSEAILELDKKVTENSIS
jgi:hypothetical protein